MRKKALVILMAAAVFALAGCGDKTDKDTGKDDKKQETSAEAETPGEAEPEVDNVGPARKLNRSLRAMEGSSWRLRLLLQRI